MSLASIEDAVAVIAAGGMVIVVDDDDRENEGDLVMAADAADAASLAFMVNHTSGVICVPMLGEDLQRLDVPMMVVRNEDPKGTAYTVSVDAREGVDTGISAADRARTIRVLADPASVPGDIGRPGHVFPLRYQPGGVLRRPGHTEAAVDLARLAGRRESGVIAELVNADGTMQRRPELERFAAEHGLLIVSIADLIAHRRRTESIVERIVETTIPTPYGEWRAVGYRSSVDELQHVALVLGEPREDEAVLVRMHSECLTGDVFRSLRCDCGAQLDLAMARIASEGRGVIVYLRGHEGRGIGLLDKLRAYRLQDDGADTVDANLRLGLPADARDYGTGASILVDLGLRNVRLLTNNPVKRAALGGFGLVLAGREPLEVAANHRNAAYLATKAERFGHELEASSDAPVSTGVGDIAAQGALDTRRVRRPTRRGIAMAPPEASGADSEDASPAAAHGGRNDR
jgi:3,4-dihydroxy 2-butanone 4-phosphate synthase/GTP cyclohydrolase II